MCHGICWRSLYSLPQASSPIFIVSLKRVALRSVTADGLAFGFGICIGPDFLFGSFSL